MGLSKDEEVKLRELLESWEDTQRALRFFKFVGKVLAWTIAIGAGVATMWSAFKGH